MKKATPEKSRLNNNNAQLNYNKINKLYYEFLPNFLGMAVGTVIGTAIGIEIAKAVVL